jgi:hypothetical protein
LHRGLLRGQMFSGQSAEEIMSRYIEINEGGGRPLVKVYSRREARQLFSMFREVKTEVEQLIRPEFYLLGRLIPEFIFRRLRRLIGWNLIITAYK